MKRIFFFDIDHTLLDHRTFTIPESALNAIDALRRNGHTIVVATGRSRAQAQPFARQVQPDYLITQNGARILKDDRETLSIPLPISPLVELFDWARAQSHPFGANLDGIGYLSEAAPRALEPMATTRTPYQTDDPAYLRQPVHQAWLFYDERLDPQTAETILTRFPAFDLVRWHRTAIDIMPRGVNKWTGCQWVLRQTGFSPEQAIAFGDGLNDMQMLQGVGIGVAMGNGHPELQAVADHVAPALDCDGIAIALAQLMKSGSIPQISPILRASRKSHASAREATTAAQAAGSGSSTKTATPIRPERLTSP